MGAAALAGIAVSGELDALRATLGRIVARESENAASLARMPAVYRRHAAAIYLMESSDHLAELIAAVSAYLETLD